jgi:hypothetical protein
MNGKSNGSYYVRSLTSGKLYLVEAIGLTRTGFGGSLDKHCRGSIRERDSRITDSTCSRITYSRNPQDAIDQMERR